MGTDPPGDDPDTIRPAAWRALLLGACGLVLVGFNSTATNIAFDAIGDSYPDVPDTTTAFVASGYLVGMAAFLPISGRLADRRGPRQIFQLGIVLFAVSAALSALAPTVWVLIAARVLQALAGALVIPASLSMALPLFPDSRKATAVSTSAAFGPVSAAISPSTSAFVLELSSWRWLYALSAPVAAVVWVAATRLPDLTRRPDSSRRLDVVGSAIGTVAIALTVLAIGKGSDWGWLTPTTVVVAGVAVVLLTWFVMRSRQHPEPLIELGLFRDRQVWMPNLANTLVSITSLSIWLVWPLFLVRVWDYSTAQVGLALTAGPLGAMTMSMIGGRVADRIGYRVPITLGALVMIFAVGWSWLVLPPDGTYFRHFLPSIAAFGSGWGLCSPTMNGLALAAVSESRAGAMHAAYNMFRNVAGAVGVAAAVAILGPRDRPDLIAAFDRAFLFFFVCTVLAAIVAIVLYPSPGRPRVGVAPPER